MNEKTPLELKLGQLVVVKERPELGLARLDRHVSRGDEVWLRLFFFSSGHFEVWPAGQIVAAPAGPR